MSRGCVSRAGNMLEDAGRMMLEDAGRSWKKWTEFYVCQGEELYVLLSLVSDPAKVGQKEEKGGGAPSAVPCMANSSVPCMR